MFAGLKESTEHGERAPTALREFSTEFMKQIEMDCASKPRTVKFHRDKLDRLPDNTKLAEWPFDRLTRTQSNATCGAGLLDR